MNEWHRWSRNVSKNCALVGWDLNRSPLSWQPSILTTRPLCTTTKFDFIWSNKIMKHFYNINGSNLWPSKFFKLVNSQEIPLSFNRNNATVLRINQHLSQRSYINLQKQYNTSLWQTACNLKATF